MKKDIILCGVGGQGILSIATIIGQAATEAGLYLKQAEVEAVDFWQSIDAPDAINVVPVYTSSAGALTTGAAQTQDKIFGLIHDKDAMGYSDVNNWAATTPLNIDGGYWNEAHHSTFKSMLDNTEKAVVLLLD